jgi:hypothetical protein
LTQAASRPAANRGIAVAKVVDGLGAHPGRLARLDDHSASGEAFEEEALLLRGPAVVAEAAGLGEGVVRLARDERVDEFGHVVGVQGDDLAVGHGFLEVPDMFHVAL